MKERRLRITDEPRLLAELLATVFVDSTVTRMDFVFGHENLSIPAGKTVHITVEYAEDRRCDPEAS